MRVTAGGRGGFTLIEALIAMFLATLIVVLVGSIFLAQNSFYTDVVRRSEAQDHARSVVELVTTDVRSAAPDGIGLADSLEFAFRVPFTMGMICGFSGGRARTYLPSGSAGLDTLGVTGYGIRSSDGSWSYYASDWGTLFESSGRTIADACAVAGMDTVGVPDEHFIEMNDVATTPSPTPRIGDGITLYQFLHLQVADSDLAPGSLGLFRGTFGDTLTEFSSGLGERTHFEYRLQGSNSYSPQVTGADLNDINSVRIVAHAVSQEGDPSDRYEFEIVQDVPLRNAR